MYIYRYVYIYIYIYSTFVIDLCVYHLLTHSFIRHRQQSGPERCARSRRFRKRGRRPSETQPCASRC